MSSKSKSTAFLLAFLIGFLGAHRFYIGRKITGALILALFIAGIALTAINAQAVAVMAMSPEPPSPTMLLPILIGGTLFFLAMIWQLIDSVLIAGGLLRDGTGAKLYSGPPDPDRPQAGFWVRFASHLVDGFIVSMTSSVIAGVLSVVGVIAIGGMAATGGAPGMTTPDAAAALHLGLMLLSSIGIGLVYFTVCHGSAAQATIGKRVFGIRLTGPNDQKVSYFRAAGRFFGYLLSAIPLYLGFIIAAFTRDKRALHDMISGTRVIYSASQEQPLAQASPAAMPSENIPPPSIPQVKPQLALSGASATSEAAMDTSTKAALGAGSLLLVAAVAASLLG